MLNVVGAVPATDAKVPSALRRTTSAAARPVPVKSPANDNDVIVPSPGTRYGAAPWTYSMLGGQPACPGVRSPSVVEAPETAGGAAAAIAAAGIRKRNGRSTSRR